MNKFFKKVEANKPEASRGVSAEIFVIGIGYLAPDYIDPKLLDPKDVFKDTESDFLTLLQNKEVNSIDKIFQKRKKRYIDDDTPMTMFKKLSFQEFLDVRNPYSVFVDFNQITFSQEEKDKYLEAVKAPADYTDLLEDIRIIGKREVASLIKWRDRIKAKLGLGDHRAPKEPKPEFSKKEYDTRDEDLLDNEIEQAYLKEKKDEKAKLREKEKRLMLFAKQGGGGQAGLGATIEEQLDNEMHDFDFGQAANIMNSGKLADYYEGEDAHLFDENSG